MEIDWDLLWRESDKEEQASVVRAGKKREEAPMVAPTVSSSSSDSSGVGYCISFGGGKTQMKCIHYSMRGPC